MIIVYALCNKSKGICGYGVFDGETIQEYSIEDTSILIGTGEIRNAVLDDDVIVITNCKMVLPTFCKGSHDALYPHSPIYVVCRCRADGVEGYLVLNQSCELEFVSRADMVDVCQVFIVANVRLVPLSSGKLHPVQYHIPFKHIGDIDFE